MLVFNYSVWEAENQQHMSSYKQAKGKNNMVNTPEGSKKLMVILFPQYFASSGVRTRILLKLAALKVPNKNVIIF